MTKAMDVVMWIWLATVAAAFAAFSLQARQVRRLSSIEMLYEFNRKLASEQDSSLLADLTLSHAKQLTGATHAELVLFDPLGYTLWWQLAADAPAAESAVVDAADGWWTTRSGRRDALIAPIQFRKGLHGMLLAADPAGKATFTKRHLDLLETLGTHVGVELDTIDLLDQLRSDAADTAQMALRDSLTGLPNRRWFASHITAELRAERPVSVLLMDLDRFKEINDTLGHVAGDRVLVAVAERLTEAIGGRGLLARFGGDEFALVVNDDCEAAVCEFATVLIRALHEPIAIDHVAVDIGASIGVAIAPIHGSDPESLLQHADVAMYLAKDRQSGVEVYRFDRDVNDVRRLALVSELRRAIAADGLAVHYQPQVEMKTGVIIGVEALVRWTSEQYGPIEPEEFIPLAECTGLIDVLTDRVLRIALADCATWHMHGWQGSVSVNLSPRSLLDQDLPAKVLARLEEAGLAPEALILEITETFIMCDPDRTIQLLEQLRSTGVRLAIDDFGTGYSSLSHLKRLPVSELKIDRSFVANVEWDHGDQAIVRATIRLAHDLGLRIVAEGVETRTTQVLLETWGADQAQGFYFGRPVPAATFAAHLALPVAHPAPRPGVPKARPNALVDSARAMSIAANAAWSSVTG